MLNSDADGDAPVPPAVPGATDGDMVPVAPGMRILRQRGAREALR